ncbi:MAG: radical SAM family heme chaperone HemW [Cyclobacteriaceae bacterium]
MSGIYIHIPFCKKACHYCDFHFSTNSQYMTELVDMICEELLLRKNFLNLEKAVETLYFGGGTPSLLPLDKIQQILSTIYKNYPLNLKEITLEANPDDLQKEKLNGYLDMGINRLSIGIQSFQDPVLSFYNRSHNASESLQAIDRARNSGFDKLSIDLIFGYPHQDHEIWKNDLKIALDQVPDHISSYCLTIEPKTALGIWAKKGKFQPASEDFQAEQFEILQEAMENSGYLQYEISNFAKPGAFSIHNSNYWKGIPYLGVGPSAHSFDGADRGHNLSNNLLYIKSLAQRKLPYQHDSLTTTDNINEYVLTSIRTIWGIDNNYLKKRYQLDFLAEKSRELAFLGQQDVITIRDQHVYLTKKGKLLADYIASKLFV